jgi:hypothetical protein
MEVQALVLAPTAVDAAAVVLPLARDPEQTRVAAGSEVLLALLEVLKSYAQQLEHAVEAMRMSLELMVQLLGRGECSQLLCPSTGVLNSSSTTSCMRNASRT